MPKLQADGQEFPISAEAWDALKDAARPFELPDDVLRRLLGIGSRAVATSRSTRRKPKSGARRSRVASDLLLPESEYEIPILQALSETGGRRPTREVVEEVGRVLNGRLTDVDNEPIRDGGPPRWQNRVQFTRLHLVKTGFMKADSPRGVWEISPAGEERLKESTS